MVEVPMMTETSRGLLRLRQWQTDIRRSMFPIPRARCPWTILLPDEGTFGEFEDSLSAQALERIFEGHRNWAHLSHHAAIRVGVGIQSGPNPV